MTPSILALNVCGKNILETRRNKTNGKKLMVKVKTKGSPAGLYFYLYKNIVIYIGQGTNVFKRANEDFKEKIGNKKFDEIKYITEDMFPFLSDERYRQYYEYRWIYKFRDTVVNKRKHEPSKLGHFIEKMFLWDHCPEVAWLSPSTTRRDFVYQNTFKDRSRWHIKGSNYAPNFYPKTWEQNLDYDKPLFVNGHPAFNFLIKPNFKYEDVKKPISKRFKGKKQFLKIFTKDEAILSRRLHNE